MDRRIRTKQQLSSRTPIVKVLESIVLLSCGAASFTLLTIALISPTWISVEVPDNKTYISGLFFGCIAHESNVNEACSAQISILDNSIAVIIGSFLVVALVGMLVDVFVIIVAFYHRSGLLSFSIIFHTLVEVLFAIAMVIVTWVICMRIYPKNYMMIQFFVRLSDTPEYVLMENMAYNEGMVYSWISLGLHVFLLVLKIIIYYYHVNSKYGLLLKHHSPPPYKA